MVAHLTVHYGVDENTPINELPEFYSGSVLNYAENVLIQPWTGVAIMALSEASDIQPLKMCWDALRQRVKKTSNALRACGVGKGDVVACKITLSLGFVHVWLTSCSPGFQHAVSCDRFSRCCFHRSHIYLFGGRPGRDSEIRTMALQQPSS